MNNEDYFDTVYQTKDIVRLALLVAYSDGSLYPQEYEKAIEVFCEVAEEYFGEHDRQVLTGQVERIAEGLRDEVDGLEHEEILTLALDTADRIEEAYMQELAITSALRIAYGDCELDELEAACITTIADNWGISLKSLI